MDNTKFKIWMAGFYEGEGSIYNDPQNNNRIRISIAQNDRSPLDRALSIWGGNISRRVRKSPASDKICIGHEWRIGHNASIKFIDYIQPYMRVPYKIRQIELSLEKFKSECETPSKIVEIRTSDNSVDKEIDDELVASLSNLTIGNNTLPIDHFKIWMAGFYEAEGTVVNDISNDNKIRMSLAQNDRTPLDLAKERWGGTVRERVRKSPASYKICHGHEWRLSHHDTLKFFNDIRSFMIIPYKIGQLTRVIAQSEIRTGRRFHCKFCDKDYASPSGRRRHEKTVHNQA